MTLARTRLALVSAALALAVLLLASPFPAYAAPTFTLEATSDTDTIVGGAVETRLRVQNTGDESLDSVVVTFAVPGEFNVGSIDTGPATAVEYQKNGTATWIPLVSLGSNVAVGSFPGFIPGDYVSGLRFSLGTIPVGFDDDQIAVRSTAVNPPNGGGSAYSLPRTVAATITLDGEAAGTPLTQVSDTTTTVVDVPKARPAPQIAIVSGSPALPGQTVRYRVTMGNGTFAPLDNPVIADLLPAHVTYVPASWTLTKNIGGCASSPTFSATPNFNGSGRTLLQWSWAGAGCSILSGDEAAIEFNVTVNAGTPPTGAGSIANRLALVNFSTPTSLVRRDNCATSPADEPIFTAGGFEADKLCFSPAAELSVNAAASMGATKYVRGQLDSVFQSEPQVGQTVQGGQITYQLELDNTGNVDFQNIELIDILPYATPAPGNVGVSDRVPLGTAWTPRLAGPVTISPAISELTVRYSTEVNPCRPNLAPTNPGCTPMVDGVAPGPGVWSENLPSDPTAVRSLKISLGNYVLPPSQTVRITIPMFAPSDAPLAAPGPNSIFGDNDDTNVAWNSFAYEAVRVDDGSRLVVQPPPAGIEIRPVPAGLASYGDYVWNDLNQNGSQDEPPYRGVNGVTVRLYNDADGNSDTTGDQTLVGTQITHADGSGNPGYYLFPALNPGFYFAEFVPPAGFEFSPPNTTANAIDSDVDPASGRTDITQLTAGENDLTWDAGMYGVPVSIGNRVWFDTNNDRFDNDGAGAVLGSSTGIPGVAVQLFQDADGDGALTGAEQYWIAQQTTDASGFYLFTAQTHVGGVALGSPVPLYPGQYFIGVAPANMASGGPLAGYHSSGTTISNAGVISKLASPSPDSNFDHDDNGNTVRTPATFYSGGVLAGPLYVDTTEPTGEPESAGNAPGPQPIADNASNLTVDFGFYTASLGNLVWADDGAGGGTIANGLRDGGEAGVAGVIVRLYSQNSTTEILVGPDGLLGTADDGPGGMVTDAAGAYRFGNLPQGQYSVQINAPIGYVSTRDTAGTGTPNGNVDNDDNGPFTNAGTTTSNSITLTPGAAGTLNNNIVTSAAGSTFNPTLDFGIVRRYSVGNRVWNDRNNNGLRDVGEPGISGVAVRLYQSDGETIARRIDGSNVPDSTTNATGYYRFDNLPAGDYIVEVISNNFTGANPLVGFRSSTGAAGAYEPAPDPDNDIDSDDNGTAGDGVVRSQAITVGEGSGTAEPTSAIDGDGGVVSSPEAQDNQSNRTVDFGFYASMSLGNRIWEDADNNGILNGAETGISGVPVNLYLDSDNNNMPDGAAIATTTTNATGYFLFTGLITETYIIEIVPPAGYTSSTGNFGDYEPGPDADTITTDNDDNGTAGAGVIRSAPITLAVGGEPTGEPATPGLSDDARDANANYTVDFGLFRPLSLGNLVWLDANNDGEVSGGETGIAGVTVRLYRDSNTDGLPDDLATPAGVTPADAIRSMTTNASGHYLFTGLGVGDYIVEVVTPLGLSSSTGRTVPAPYEPAPDPDTVQADNDDNGTAGAGVIRSGPVTLTVGGEPTGEPATPGLSDTAPDDSSNTTVDFGLYTAMSLGNLVWNDADNSGSVNSGEIGISGVTVRLYRDDDNNGVPDDLNGTPGVSVGDAIATTTTNATGHYLFIRLSAGTYIVEIVPPVGYRSSSGALSAYEPAPDPDTVQADNDDNGNQGAGVIRSGPVTLTVGGEPTGEPATSGITDNTADSNANYTVDFGIYESYSLGDRVWEDRNNDGIDNDGADSGLGAVSVNLYRDSDASGTLSAPDTLVVTTTTTTDGFYLFTGLTSGVYLVQLPGANFADAGPLEGLTSSTGAPASSTGPYEPAPDPDDGEDAQDSGSVGAAGLTAAGWDGGVASGPITLGPGASEPTGEPATPGITDPSTDDRSNLTLDFGLYNPSLIGVSVEQAAAQADPTNLGPISFRVVFSRPIVSASFTPDDLTIGGTAPGALSATIAEVTPNDGTTFAVEVSGMSGDGTVQLSLAAGVVADIAGNPNLASASTDNTVTYDVSGPTASITPESASTANVPVRFLLSFSEPISGLSAADLTLSGTAGATSLSITEIAPNDGTTFVVAASGMTSAGTVIVGVPSGVATDAAGNPSEAAPVDAVAQFTATNPVVTGIVALDPNPTNAASARYRLSFSEPVSGLDLGDLQLSLSGGVTGATLEPATLTDGQVFTLTVQLGSGDGSLRLDLIDDGSIASVATQIGLGGAGPANGSFTNGDVYQIDRTAPTITLAPGQPDPTDELPVTFTLTIDEPIDGLSAADLVLGGTAGAADLTLTGSGTSYTVTIERVARSGTITLALPAGAVQDAAGNPSAAVAPVAINFVDDTAPQAALVAALPDQPADGSTTPYQIVVRYSDNLALDAATLGDDDLAVTGPAGVLTATLVSVDAPGDGATRVATYVLAAPGGTWDGADGGSYSVAVVADSVRDTSGNGVAATPLGSFSVPTAFWVALPMLAGPAAQADLPDLIVERVEGAGSELRVSIRNIGVAPASKPFWVDVYINPDVAPSAVNQTWQLLGARGATWGVTSPLAPGDSLTLTIGDQFFKADLSDLGGPLAPGTRLYAQVDSANTGSSYGAVLEQHEAAGGAYNNIAQGLAGSQALAQAGSAQTLSAAPAKAPLPRRPAE